LVIHGPMNRSMTQASAKQDAEALWDTCAEPTISGASMISPRFKSLTLAEMSPDQRRIAERRMNGPLGRLGAPQNLFIRSPETAQRIEQLSDYFRVHELAFPGHLRELVILMVARHWSAQYPWSAHYALAVDAGVSPETLAQIAAGQRPATLQPDDAIVYDFCKELLDNKSVTDAVFDAVVARYGEAGVADLIGLIGCYCTLCMGLVVDRYPPNEGPAPLLKPLAQD
jgi:4-carboxymuconolactone decarboxylase